MDIDTPMKRAKATNFLSGPTSSYTGSAIAMPSIIGSATLTFEIAATCPTLPLIWLRSTSRPIRNM